MGHCQSNRRLRASRRRSACSTHDVGAPRCSALFDTPTDAQLTLNRRSTDPQPTLQVSARGDVLEVVVPLREGADVAAVLHDMVEAFKPPAGLPGCSTSQKVRALSFSSPCSQTPCGSGLPHACLPPSTNCRPHALCALSKAAGRGGASRGLLVGRWAAPRLQPGVMCGRLTHSLRSGPPVAAIDPRAEPHHGHVAAGAAGRGVHGPRRRRRHGAAGAAVCSAGGRAG